MLDQTDHNQDHEHNHPAYSKAKTGIWFVLWLAIHTSISQGGQTRRPASAKPDPRNQIIGNQLFPSSHFHEAEPAVCRQIFPFQKASASLPRHNMISTSSHLDYGIISFLTCQTSKVSFFYTHQHKSLASLGIISAMPLLYARDLEEEGHPSQ